VDGTVALLDTNVDGVVVVVTTIDTGVASSAVVCGGFEGVGVGDCIAWIEGLFSRACN